MEVDTAMGTAGLREAWAGTECTEDTGAATLGFRAQATAVSLEGPAAMRRTGAST